MKQRKNNFNSLKKKIDTTIRKLEKNKTTENKSLISLLKEITQFQIDPKLTNEALFRTTLYSIGDAVITTDVKGNVQQMNPIAEKLCGWKESEARNKHLQKVFKIISGPTGKKSESSFNKVIKTGKIVGVANHALLISKPGNKIPIVFRSIPIKNDTGEIIGVASVFRDQREERKNQIALEESESRYRAFFDNSPDAIFLADPETGKIIDANKEALRLLKIPHSKIIKMHQSQLHPKRLETYSTKAFTEQIEAIDLKIPLENFLVTATGEEIPAEVLASMITLNGKNVVQGVFRNISERRKIESEFQKSKERMELLIEGTPHLFFYVQDLKGNIEYISPSIENITGYPVDKWLNQNHWFATDSPINQKAKDRTRNHLNGKIIPEPVYVEILHTNGSKVMIELYERPLFINGKVVGLQGVAHDITKRLEAEKNLKEIESSYTRLFDSVSEAIYILDKNGFFLEINAGAINMYGYERAELIRKTPAFVGATDKNDLESVEVSLGKAFNGEKQQFDFWGKRKNGEEFLKEVRLYPGFYFNKKVTIAIANDITEKKKAEVLLRESEKRYKLIAENTADSIALFDMNLNYTYVSPSVIKLLGYTSEELISYGFAKIISQEDLSNLKKILLEELENETIGIVDKLRNRIIELEQICKDGSKIWVEATMSFVRDNKGTPAG
ncbi:MAG: PAS domain S-box protein, partial [Ignavibacteriota bacterium]